MSINYLVQCFDTGSQQGNTGTVFGTFSSKSKADSCLTREAEQAWKKLKKRTNGECWRQDELDDDTIIMESDDGTIGAEFTITRI